MSSFLNWSWASQNVQTEVKSGENVSSESTLVLAGPSRLEYLTSQAGSNFLASSNSLLPVGLVTGLEMVQVRQISRLYEIGSKRAYQVPNRHVANFRISRIVFFGPSLLRILYALAPGRLTDPLGTPLNIDPDSQGQGVAELPDYSRLFQQTPLKGKPGYGGTDNEDNRDFYTNLASELFNTPFGLAVIFKTAQDRPYGAQYLEDCYVESHQMGLSAADVVVAESVSGQCDRITPIQLVTATTLN